jgi:hypothetical protein
MPVGTMSGAPQVLLAHHLKQLKLLTVLREYDKVAHECARDGIDHPPLTAAADRTRTDRPRTAHDRAAHPGSPVPGSEESGHVRLRRHPRS